MGAQQHEFPEKREARIALLASIKAGDIAFASLEEIDLSCRRLRAEGVHTVLKHFDLRPTLAVKHLLLDFNDIGVSGAERLAASSVCEHVVSLDLSGNELGDEGIEALCTGRVFTRLVTLRLSYNLMHDEGARALARSKAFPKLRELNLRRNRIGNEGIRALCSGDFPARLTNLNVEYNEFQREGFDLLDEAFDESKTSIW